MKILILHLMALLVSGAAFAQDYEPTNLIIDSIECVGNALTDCEVIKREIYLNAGDRLDEEEIKNSKIRLQLLALFQSVNLSLKKGDERGHVVLQVEVIESSPYFYETDVVARRNGFRYGVDLNFTFGHRNLFGNGKILQATLEPNNLTDKAVKRHSETIEYIDPHLFGEKKYFLSTSLSIVNDNDKFNSRSGDSTTFKFNLGQRIFDFSHFGIGLISTYAEQDIQTVTLPIYDTDKHSVAYTLNYGWNSEDDQYFPKEGSKLDFTYYIYENNYRAMELAFNKNWSINQKNILTLLSDTTYSYYDQDYYNTSLDFKWAYQIRDREIDKNISDIQLFVDQGFRNFKYLDGVYVGTSAGVLFDTKNLGIIKLSLFWWSL